MRRTVYLYARLFSQQLKAILEYQADFLILVVAAMLTQVLGLVFIWLVYQRIPIVQGWSYWEVIFVFAMVNFSTGISQFFFEGTWRISGLINTGGFDLILLRPVSPTLQILSGAVGMNRLGNALLGGIMMFQALSHVDIDWSILRVTIFILLFLCALVIRIAINLISNSLSFWTGAPGNAFPMMVSSLSEFVKFPLTIYSTFVQLFFSIVIPYAFINFYPASFLFNKPMGAMMGLLTPVVTVLFAAASVWMFRAGLRRYEGTGS